MVMAERNEYPTEDNSVEPDEDLAFKMLQARVRNREALIVHLDSMPAYESTNTAGIVRRSTRAVDTTAMRIVQAFEKDIEARMKTVAVAEDLKP